MDDYTSYVFDYVRESCDSCINKRSKAEKKILAKLHFPSDLRKIILGYSRISGKFVRDYAYSMYKHPKKLGKLFVKNISINLVSISKFSAIKFGISIEFSSDKFPVVRVYGDELYGITLRIAPWNIFALFINMDTRKIVNQWKRDLDVLIELYPEIANNLPDIADDIVQFLIWY